MRDAALQYPGIQRAFHTIAYKLQRNFTCNQHDFKSLLMLKFNVKHDKEGNCIDAVIVEA